MARQPAERHNWHTQLTHPTRACKRAPPPPPPSSLLEEEQRTASVLHTLVVHGIPPEGVLQGVGGGGWGEVGNQKLAAPSCVGRQAAQSSPRHTTTQHNTKQKIDKAAENTLQYRMTQQGRLYK